MVYSALTEGGYPLARLGDKRLPERFWTKIHEATNGCWEWTGSRWLTRGGYGRFAWQGGVRRAHRVSYSVLVGPIPRRKTIDHLCRNPRCVNPLHLEAVTPLENHRRTRRATCFRGHEKTPENTYKVKGRAPFCKLCHLERCSKYRELARN